MPKLSFVLPIRLYRCSLHNLKGSEVAYIEMYICWSIYWLSMDVIDR